MERDLLLYSNEGLIHPFSTKEQKEFGSSIKTFVFNPSAKSFNKNKQKVQKIMGTTPWYTDKSIIFLEEYLKKIEKSKVLEFGCGGSTFWLSTRVDSLISIEHDKDWINDVKKQIKTNNVEFIFHDAKEIEKGSDLVNKSYNDIINKFQDSYFDAILVDGRNRVECLKESDRLLKVGGLMLLDNAEREEYKEAVEFYKHNKCYKFVQDDPQIGWTTIIWIKG